MVRCSMYCYVFVVLMLTMNCARTEETIDDGFPSSTSSNSTEDVIPESYNNITGGNSFWYKLIEDCKRPTISCVQKNVYTYLDNTFEYPSDFAVTDFLTFKKNVIDFKYSKEANEGLWNSSGSAGNFSGRLMSPFEEVAGALHNKAVRFMMTHDMEVKMPETVFDGATFKVSPRALEGNGAIVKLEVTPRDDVAVVGQGATGRIFFKKIKKFFNEKLIIALIALIVVVKLIKVKLMFLLPLLLGVHAAKKLLLKVMLFLFPPLSLLFKLCHTYETGNFHGTKFHHHHHLISHGHGPPSLHHGPVELSHPPPGFDSNHGYADNEVEYGPPFGGTDFVHRKKFDQSENGDDNEIPAWNPPGQGHRPSLRRPLPSHKKGPLTPDEIEKLAARAEKDAMLKVRLQAEHQRVHMENIRLQEQLKQALKQQEQLKYQSVLLAQHQQNQRINQPQVAGPAAAASIIHQQQLPPRPPGPVISPALAGQTIAIPGPHIAHAQQQPHQPQAQHPVQAALVAAQIQQQQKKQQQQQQQRPATGNSPPQAQQQVQQGLASQVVQTVQVQTMYDPFYTPILLKIDKIFAMLSYSDEPCRERLVCSMYKNPTRFSPHSNLISAELSRDSKELQKPTSNNAAVVRFYRYVQAARDGQDQRDCLRLYPSCSINTEQ